MHDEFPALFRYPRESRELLRQLRYRHKLVKLRTAVINSLHALAINCGLSLRAQLLTSGGRARLQELRLWLKEQASSDQRVRRLRTHPGVGLLTSLCLVHTLGDISRFSSTRKVATYVGFDPVEHSSAERKVYGSISKAGSRLLRYLLVEAGQTSL